MYMDRDTPETDRMVQMIALGPKPEGAEMRLPEYAAGEILAGRFKRARFWGLFSDYGLNSPDADRYMSNNPEHVKEYDRKVFDLQARKTWFGLGKPIIVKFMRGRKDISDLLAPFEVALLTDAYFRGLEILDERKAEQKRQDEIDRQRAAWYP